MVATIGMTCLGFVISTICLMVAARSEYESISVVGSVVGILLGAGLAVYLASHTSAGPDVIWWYPIGMFAALMLVGTASAIRYGKRPRERRNHHAAPLAPRIEDRNGALSPTTARGRGV
jgi:hypothetical protein